MPTVAATKQTTDIKTKLSLKQTQQLVLTTFSCISYLRDLFPEEAYEDCRLSEMSLKRIRKGHVLAADDFLSWLESGCFDALSRHYLRTITLEIYDTAFCSTPLEIYEVDIMYPGEAESETTRINMTLKGAGSEVAMSSEEATFKKAAVSMLRSICLLTQTLDVLPEKKHLAMRLAYYDEVTERLYEPEGFRAATMDEILRIEQTKLAFLHDFGVVRHTNHAVAFGLQLNKKGRTQGTASGQLPEPGDLETTFLETCQKTQEVQQPQTDVCVVSEGNEDINTVQCHCTVNENDSDMIQCEQCHAWQHTVCAGFYSNKDKRIETTPYCCYLCQYKEMPHVFKFLTDLGCFRRILSVIYNEGMVSIEGMAARLGLPLQSANRLIDRALKEGFLTTEEELYQETQSGSTDKPSTVKKYIVAKTAEMRLAVKAYFSTDLSIHEQFNKLLQKTTGKRRKEAENQPIKKPKISVSKGAIYC